MRRTPSTSACLSWRWTTLGCCCRCALLPVLPTLLHVVTPCLGHSRLVDLLSSLTTSPSSIVFALWNAPITPHLSFPHPVQPSPWAILLHNVKQTEKEANARHALWKSMFDFMEKSNAWTEDPILDEDGNVALSIEAIRAEVDEYAARAYKMVGFICLAYEALRLVRVWWG